MLFENITETDLEEIAGLQPEGWTEIKSKFQFYIENDFCFPYKMSIDKRIVGLGCSIIFGKTAWLAHIIVGSNFRNRGIGFQMVTNLLSKLKEKTSVKSVLLMATKLGEPIYVKAGFRVVSEYVQLTREKPWNCVSNSKNVVDYRNGFYLQIIELDTKISGENREPLLKQFFHNSSVYQLDRLVDQIILKTTGIDYRIYSALKFR